MKYIVMALMLILCAMTTISVHASEQPVLNCGNSYFTFKRDTEEFDNKIDAMSYQSLVSTSGRNALHESTVHNFQLGYYALACDQGNDASRVAQKLWDLGIPDGDVLLMNVLGHLQRLDYQGAYRVYRYDSLTVSQDPISSYWKYLALLIVKKQLCQYNMSKSFPLVCLKDPLLYIKEVRRQLHSTPSNCEIIVSLFDGKHPDLKKLRDLPSQVQASRVLIDYIDSGVPEFTMVVREYARLQYVHMHIKSTDNAG